MGDTLCLRFLKHSYCIGAIVGLVAYLSYKCHNKHPCIHSSTKALWNGLKNSRGTKYGQLSDKMLKTALEVLMPHKQNKTTIPPFICRIFNPPAVLTPSLSSWYQVVWLL